MVSRRSSRRHGSGETPARAGKAPVGNNDISVPEAENDDDYKEDYKDDDEEGEEVEDDDEEAYSGDDEDAEEKPAAKRRKTVSRSVTPSAKEDLEELEDEGEEEQEVEGAEDEGEDDEGRRIVKKKPAKVKGRRGRKPLPSTPGPVVDDNGKKYDLIDEEYNLTEDEEGETKITKNGELQGGRQFRVRTFTVKGRGPRLYMLSTEPARCMGFRDSYLLFQKHRLLHKVVLNQDEKFDLIDRDIIPHSYKGRVIGLVTARSIYREFGAKIVVGGRYVTDDYYGERVKKMGHYTEGELAEPEDTINRGGNYNQNQFVAWHGASNIYHQSTAQVYQPHYESLELKSMRALKSANLVNEENWMFKHAEAARDFETTLLAGRQVVSRGFKDTYTGITMIPELTQSTKVGYQKVVDPESQHTGKRKSLIYETLLHSNNLTKTTGLKDVPLSIFEDVVDEETKRAILRQQQLETAQFV